MKIGVVGKKYGLQRPAGLSLFKTDDDEEGKDVSKIIRDASERKSQKQKQQEQARILAEDPTAYDYDSVYDAMHQSRKAAAPQKETTRKPKYIHALLEKAAIRNREQDIVYARMLQKERETEGDTYAGKEKFLTAAYKKQLQENKLWQEEEERKAALEDDVTKKEDLGSFYVNLLTRNEAYGGGQHSSPPVQSEEPNNRAGSGSDKATDSKLKEKNIGNKVEVQIQSKSGERHDSESSERDNSNGERSKSRERETPVGEKVANESEGNKQMETKKEDALKKRPHDSAPATIPTEYNEPIKQARRSNDDATVKAARERYLKRKAEGQR